MHVDLSTICTDFVEFDPKSNELEFLKSQIYVTVRESCPVDMCFSLILMRLLCHMKLTLRPSESHISLKLFNNCALL